MNRTKKEGLLKTVGAMLAVALLSATLAAQTEQATRYDNQNSNYADAKVSGRNQFHDIRSSVEGGIVTLMGTSISTRANWMLPNSPAKPRR